MADFRLDPAAVAAGYRLTAYSAIGSTNEQALADPDPADRHWLVTDDQTAGRGRRGRTWIAPKGNLAATLRLVVEADPRRAALLGFVAGVALEEALAPLVPDAAIRISPDDAEVAGAGRPGRIALKWPNDVLAGEAKLAGILLEARPLPGGRQVVAIGLGVNVVAAPPLMPYPTTSLADLGATADAPTVFAHLSAAWIGVYALWRDGQGADEILARWRASAAGLGAAIAVRHQGRVVRGTFETVDPAGRLIVREENGAEIAISAGDVHFGATVSARS